MSAPPKLRIAEREQLAEIDRKKRILTKLIATLQDEKRRLPTKRDLARQLGIGYTTVRRVLSGDPYRNQHPADV